MCTPYCGGRCEDFRCQIFIKRGAHSLVVDLRFVVVGLKDMLVEEVDVIE